MIYYYYNNIILLQLTICGYFSFLYIGFGFKLHLFHILNSYPQRVTTRASLLLIIFTFFFIFQLCKVDGHGCQYIRVFSIFDLVIKLRINLRIKYSLHLCIMQFVTFIFLYTTTNSNIALILTVKF